MAYSASARSRLGRTRALTAAALITALLCASAWIVIPGTVPVTFQVLLVVLAALVLSPAWAGAAVGLYVLVGTAGLPVFAGGSGGIGVIAGPTGGYILGFVLGAFAGAVARRVLTMPRAARRGAGLPAHGPIAADAIASLTVIAVVYAVGTVRLGAVLDKPLAEAIVIGAVPFLVPDLLKAAVAVLIARRVRRAVAQ